MPRLLLFTVSLLAAGLFATGAGAQSSSSGNADTRQQPNSSRRSGAEAAGAAITLETSEPLFDLAAGLNACGYDDDLKDSNPLRTEIRTEMDAAFAAAPAAARARTALCQYIREHELNDRGRELAQYISLSLFLEPPPGLLLTADQTDMPPDALQVVNILPLLRTFVAATQLHALWLKHRPEYEAILNRVHDPLTRAVLNTNVYLRVPVSSYDGRSFLVLVEPLLAPSAPNARIYGTDYDFVTSANAAGDIRLDQVRHLYLHFIIEPLVYARASSIERMLPLLKPLQQAPLEYVYKTDVTALLTECLIKAVEARTMDVGLVKPAKPSSRERVELARYDEALGSYNRQAEAIRRAQVELDMRQGWIMTDYFYAQMAAREHDSGGLKDDMGEMVYSMDVGRERHRAEQIRFLPEGSGEFVRRTPRAPTGMMLAEKKMLEGDLDGARALAEQSLNDPRADHAEAQYVVARVDLMEGDPETSMSGFGTVLAGSHNPNTLAWAHIYRGRLFDTKDPPDRADALSEYKAALAVPSLPLDARIAAEKGLQTAFTVPKTTHTEEGELDPTGKAEKDAYRPDEPNAPHSKPSDPPR